MTLFVLSRLRLLLVADVGAAVVGAVDFVDAADVAADAGCRYE